MSILFNPDKYQTQKLNVIKDKPLLFVDGTGETGAIGPGMQELFPISTSIWLSGGRGEPPSSDMQQGSTEENFG